MLHSVTKRRYQVDLAAHMAECDANYLRLLRLMPEVMDRDLWEFELAPKAGRQEECAAGEKPDSLVRIRVTERARYTTDARLTQLVPPGTAVGDWWRPPSFFVRLYHDAGTAEVLEYLDERGFKSRYDYPNPSMRLPNEKAQINRMLSEYLALCLDIGVSVARDVDLPQNLDEPRRLERSPSLK